MPSQILSFPTLLYTDLQPQRIPSFKFHTHIFNAIISFFPTTIHLWNNLPGSVKESKSIRGFKHYKLISILFIIALLLSTCSITEKNNFFLKAQCISTILGTPLVQIAVVYTLVNSERTKRETWNCAYLRNNKEKYTH